MKTCSYFAVTYEYIYMYMCVQTNMQMDIFIVRVEYYFAAI